MKPSVANEIRGSVAQGTVRPVADECGGESGADEDFFQMTQDDTYTTAVNDKTDIAGYGPYGNGFFAKHIELNEGPNDAKEVQPFFINLVAGMATYPYGMNDQRVVVGAYHNEDGVVHGFVATPNF